jgi:hypothetical protein
MFDVRALLSPQQRRSSIKSEKIYYIVEAENNKRSLTQCTRNSTKESPDSNARETAQEITKEP